MIDVRIRSGLALRVLLGCIACVLLAGVVAAIAKSGFGYESLYRTVPLFHLDHEGNVPAFFSSIMLLMAAGLLAFLSLAPLERQEGRRHSWRLLALGFLYLAFDEATEIHERLNRPMREALDAPGFETAWVLPALVIVAAVAAYF